MGILAGKSARNPNYVNTSAPAINIFFSQLEKNSFVARDRKHRLDKYIHFPLGISGSQRGCGNILAIKRKCSQWVDPPHCSKPPRSVGHQANGSEGTWSNY